MRRAVRAGLAYGLFAFLLGFVLGTARVLLVAPQLGEVRAVLLESPLMLGASWLIAGHLIRRWGVLARIGIRLAMGLSGFALLMACEWLIGLQLFGRTVEAQLAALSTPAGSIGLASQSLFALVPVVRLATERRGGRGRD